MKAIINGKIYYNNHFIRDHVLVYSDKIEAIVHEKEFELDRNKRAITHVIDGKNQYVVPGLIDVHIHGYNGADTMDGTKKALETMSKGIVKNGVTSFLATTMTMDEESIRKALTCVRSYMDEQKGDEQKGAQIIGVHLEGPYINPEFKGAQSDVYMQKPTDRLLKEYGDIIKVVTIAPELEGAIKLIKSYGQGVNFSLGHTAATAQTASEAFDAGAKSVTHLFNAMTGLHHREPGVVGAALTHECYCELIADNFHVNPQLYALVKKIKGNEKVLLITDCTRAGGLKEGEYDLGGQLVRVKDRQCRLESGTLAGSVLELNRGLRHMVQELEHTLSNEEALEEVLPMATINQARYLGYEKVIGSLENGKQADIVLLNKEIMVEKTIVKGKLVYENQL